MTFAHPLRIATFVLAVAVTAGAGTAFADDATPQQISAAKAVIKVMHVSDTFDGILPSIAQQAKQQFVARDPANSKQIEDTVENVALELAKTRPDLDNAIAQAWAARFTIDELNQMASFYASPVGVKLLQYEPAIVKDSIAAAHAWQEQTALQLQEKVAKALEKPSK